MTYPQQYETLPPAGRKKWPWIVGGAVLVGILGIGLILGGAVGGLDSEKDAVAGKMGTATTDGKLRFTVTKMECGAQSIGPADGGQRAQGQFCLVDVGVENVGATAEMFSDLSQKAYDPAGREYTSDPSAGVWANKDYSTFVQSVNPGTTVKGRLVFDVPDGTKLSSIVMHESITSAGVKIPLK